MTTNHYYEEMKKSKFYLLDFEKNEYNGLLINRENYSILRKWLLPLKNIDNQENLKFNLLYKASNHGFSQNDFKERTK